MIILRMYWRIRSLVKTLLYRVLFGGRFAFPFDSTFRRNFGVYLGKGARIAVGHNVFFNRGCSINCLESVEIGDNCIFGENVKIYDQNHRFADRNEIIRNQGYSIAPVKIGGGLLDLHKYCYSEGRYHWRTLCHRRRMRGFSGHSRLFDCP